MLDINYSDNFQHIIEYEREGNYPGCEGCNPSKDNYDSCHMCRCYTIDKITYDSDCYWNAVSIVQKYSNSNPERKALEVMVLKNLTSSELEDMFEATWDHGYYGDEVEHISATPVFHDHINYLNSCTDIELLHHAFMKEYGKLTNVVKNATSICLNSISVKKIVTPPGYQKFLEKQEDSYFPQNKYRGMFRNKPLKKIKELFPLVCVELEDGNFKLIDGCHRFMDIQSKQKPAVRKVPVLVIKTTK